MQKASRAAMTPVMPVNLRLDARENSAALDSARPDAIGSDPDTGCSDLLVKAGLRPNRQRMLLCELLFAKGDRHVTAEMLFREAQDARVGVSLATVYNTLNRLTLAGLLQRIGLDGRRSIFDTRTIPHPHYYLPGEDTLIDILETDLLLNGIREAPPNHEVCRVDLIIHLRRKPS
jgi:Fur family iron response transcriptional regulator